MKKKQLTIKETRKAMLQKRKELKKILDNNTGYYISKVTGFDQGLVYRLQKDERKLKMEKVLDFIEKFHRGDIKNVYIKK